MNSQRRYETQVEIASHYFNETHNAVVSPYKTETHGTIAIQKIINFFLDILWSIRSQGQKWNLP